MASRTTRKYRPVEVGQTFGRLTIVEFVGRNAHGQAHWLCRCACGEPHIAYVQNLFRGVTQSCGCLQKERTSKVNTHHGDSQCSEWKYLYQTWLRIQQRCHNPNDASYSNYGGRGIRVCDEWRSSYEAFAEYMLWNLGDRPAGYSIDRTDNDGHYEPGNIRWANRQTQYFNSRSHLSRRKGVKRSFPARRSSTPIERR
jgi:hypothetical protein